jgi:hypothetical protein
MINVSDLFKETVRENSKEIKAYVYDVAENEYIRDDDDLKYLKISTNGEIIRTVMRQVDIKYYGSHNYLDKSIQVGIGVVLPLVINKGAFIFIGIGEPAEIEQAGHGLVTGDKVKLDTTGGLPIGLEVDTYYFVVNKYNTVGEESVLDANAFYLATTYDNAINSVLINTSGMDSGTHTLLYYPIGSFDEPEYIDYGTFKIIEQEKKRGNDYTSVKGYDLMYESLRRYHLTNFNYPCTLKELLDEICLRLGWTLGTTSFFNDDLVVEADLYAFQGLTYRKVLEHIAEATGTMMYFNVNNELVLKEISTTSIDSVLADDLRTLNIESQFGNINSFVIATVPPEDDFVFNGGYFNAPILDQQDDELLAEDGEAFIEEQANTEIDNLVQLRVENNFLLNQNRESYIEPLGDKFIGYNFYPFESNTIGLLYYEIGDRVVLEDQEDTQFATNIFDITIELGDGGFSEVFGAGVPSKSRIPYKTESDVVSQTIDKTEIDNKNIRSISADKITAGTLSAVTSLGDESIKLDGENRRIVINDEDGNPIILMGYQDNGF